jgi:hypothetical protein
MLWNMVVDSIFYNAHYQAHCYADDVVLLQKGKFIVRFVNACRVR